MRFYAIRQKSTGLFLPASLKAFTHDEPTDGKPPRLFNTAKGAKNALHWWLKGRITVDRGGGYSHATGDYDDWDKWNAEAVPERRADDMEVVTVSLRVAEYRLRRMA